MNEVIQEAVEDVYACPREEGICGWVKENEVCYAHRQAFRSIGNNPGLDELPRPPAEAVGRKAELERPGYEHAKMVADSASQAPRQVLRGNARLRGGGYFAYNQQDASMWYSS